jgi:glucose/arabinose dehydrogenase
MAVTTTNTRPRVPRILAGVALGVFVMATLVFLAFVARPTQVKRWIAGVAAGRELGDDALRQQLPATGAARAQIAIALEKVADGFEQPTDIQFVPDQDQRAVVLEKTGKAHWLDLAQGEHDELFRVEVLTDSEEGLLGLAFHPAFARNGRFFINYVASKNGEDTTHIAEWKLSPKTGMDVRGAKAEPVRMLLEVKQPYANHNAGQLVFGPDGKLYIGLGDGGARDDPHGNGQNPRTLLGSMLRIDVDGRDEGKPYRVPPDNPFVGKPEYLPEIWAYGLRNPWRYSFDPEKRLIVADVGQDHYEEIDIVQAGDNLGWKIKEGASCYKGKPGDCERGDLVDPIFAYGRDQGASITGGFVYTGQRITALRGLYVFADYVSGRLWAIELPRDRKQAVTQAKTLGQWPILPATFGRDAHGEIYVASFTRGEIYRLAPGQASDSK